MAVRASVVGKLRVGGCCVFSYVDVSEYTGVNQHGPTQRTITITTEHCERCVRAIRELARTTAYLILDRRSN